MIRLFVPDDLAVDTPIALSAAHHHYLQHVMRRQSGDEIQVFNGRDGEWLAVLEMPDKKRAFARLCRQTRLQTVPPRLILCPALIKKEPMDFVLQKATELGVSDIYPLITERAVVTRLNPDRARTLVTEAAEQSERLSLPVLHPAQSLVTVLRTLPPDVIPVCLAERGTTTAPLTSSEIYAFFVGPEGGWSPAELDLFARANARFWHLGETILRAETASLAALSCARFCLS